MTSPLDIVREPTEKYRQEFEVAPPKKKSFFSSCCPRKKQTHHDRNLTKHEVDYTIMIRGKKIIEESKA